MLKQELKKKDRTKEKKMPCNRAEAKKKNKKARQAIHNMMT